MRDPLHLTLLRHGRSLADDEEVHEGRYDSPLTEAGRGQARSLAAYWQANPPGFEHVVCSPLLLLRARETAGVVSTALGLSPEVNGTWMEFDNGPVAGLPFAEAARRYPVPDFRGRYEVFTEEGGESTVNFMQRAQRGLEALVQGKYTNVLVVFVAAWEAEMPRGVAAGRHLFRNVTLGPLVRRSFSRKDARVSCKSSQQPGT